MMALLSRIFRPRGDPSDGAYKKAMLVSDDLLARMQAASPLVDAARAITADLWRQKHNVPFMASVIETVQEMKSPLLQKPGDR